MLSRKNITNFFSRLQTDYPIICYLSEGFVQKWCVDGVKLSRNYVREGGLKVTYWRGTSLENLSGAKNQAVAHRDTGDDAGDFFESCLLL